MVAQSKKTLVESTAKSTKQVKDFFAQRNINSLVGNARSTSDGFSYVTDDGEPAGADTATKTSGNVEEVNVTGLVQAAGFAKVGKDGKSGDGKTNATSKSKPNLASNFMKGKDKASAEVDKIEAGMSTIEFFGSGNEEGASTGGSQTETANVTGWITVDGKAHNLHNDVVPADRASSDSIFLMQEKKVDSVTVDFN